MWLAFFIIKNLNKKFEIGDVIGIINLEGFIYYYYYVQTFIKNCIMTHGIDGDISDMSSKS